MDMFKKILAVFLRVGISAILLVLLFKFNKIDVHELLIDIKGADKAFLAVGFLIFFVVFNVCELMC